MPWPPRQPRRDEIDENDLAAYDAVVGRMRDMGRPNPEVDAGYYGRLLQSPQLASLLAQIGRTVRALGERGDSYSHADREFVDQVLSVDLGSNIVQQTHLNDALSTGVRLGAIEALREGRESDLTPDEARLTDFIRRVAGGRMDGETWDWMERRIGERGAVEYAVFILFLQLTMRLMETVGMPTMTDAEVSRLIDEFRTGKRGADDFRARIK
jgi:hypothetical protein